jgi:stress-induced morphogen
MEFYNINNNIENIENNIDNNNVRFSRDDTIYTNININNINIDRPGTIYDRVDPLEDTSIENEPNNQTNDHFNVNIYRYKFTVDFTDELFKFSKIHQYDDRKSFKEAWNIWIEENDDIINQEYKRLKEAGYDGDILDKMFKSARYYFRKKSTEKKEPSKRRIYVGSQKDLLEAMDQHIKSNIVSGDFKPSQGFNEFCKEHTDILKQSIVLLYSAGFKDENEIETKIKKTYKNRYFIAISK